MKHATIGRTLLYTLSAADGCHDHAVGEQRPATVVRVFGGVTRLYNVQVFTDGTNDFPNELHGGSGLLRKTSVAMADAPEEGCLNWPEPATFVKAEPLPPVAELEPEPAPPEAPAAEEPKKQGKKGKKPARS